MQQKYNMTQGELDVVKKCFRCQVFYIIFLHPSLCEVIKPHVIFQNQRSQVRTRSQATSQNEIFQGSVWPQRMHPHTGSDPACHGRSRGKQCLASLVSPMVHQCYRSTLMGGAACAGRILPGATMFTLQPIVFLCM